MDPDDGYIRKIPVRIQPTLNHFKPTISPQNYEITTPTANDILITQSTPYANRPLGGYESSSERPYRISVTTQDTRQHLTETTQYKSSEVRYANHRPDYHPALITKNPYHKLRLTPITTISPVTHNSIVETGPTPTVNTVNVPLRNLNTTSLTILLKKLKEANHLPPSFNTENVDNSIRTLAKILNNLKKTKTSAKPYTTETIQQTIPVDYDDNDEEILNQKHNAGKCRERNE